MFCVLFCMDCGVFSKAPQGLVGSPCNALILLPHSLPTHPPTHHPSHGTRYTGTQYKVWQLLLQPARDIPSRFPIVGSPLYQACFQTASISAFT